MPEKLKRCVQHVKDQGKSEDSAWAICVDSTGLKPHKKKKEVKKAELSPMEKAWEEFKKAGWCPQSTSGEHVRNSENHCSRCGKYLGEPAKVDRANNVFEKPYDIDKAWLPYKEWKAKQEKEKGEKKDKKKKK